MKRLMLTLVGLILSITPNLVVAKDTNTEARLQEL